MKKAIEENYYSLNSDLPDEKFTEKSVLGQI